MSPPRLGSAVIPRHIVSMRKNIAVLSTACILGAASSYAEERQPAAFPGDAAPPSEANEAAPPADDTFELRASWRDGLRLQSGDGSFVVKLRGRIHSDWAAAFSNRELRDDFPSVSSSDSGTRLRRARLGVSGTLYRNFVFSAEYDFAGGEAKPKDVYLGVQGIPWAGRSGVGHFKAPFSMETIASANDITFLERGLPEALVPVRNAGLMASNLVLDDRATWAVGVFRDVDDTGDGFGEDELWNLTGRITALPFLTEDGKRLAHVGMSYSHKFRDDDEFQVSSRPEAGLFGARLVDSGSLLTDGVDLLGHELALAWGPWTLQAEYVRAWVASSGADESWDGTYVELSWVLTGESRPYDARNADFDGVEPRRPFDPSEGGWGAWEAAVRHSWLDLDDTGGELNDVTVGLNWYLNANARLMLNYVHGDVSGSGATNIVEARAQVAF